MQDHFELELMLQGYGLTTAQILYRMPDHPAPAADIHLATLRSGAEISRTVPLPRLLARKARRAASFGELHAQRKLISPNEWRNVERGTGASLGASALPKIAEPTRTLVAPNAIAVS